MFCYKCGSQLLDGSGSCQQCGATQLQEPSVSQTPMPPSSQPQAPMSFTHEQMRRLRVVACVVAVLLAVIAVVLLVPTLGAVFHHGSETWMGRDDKMYYPVSKLIVPLLLSVGGFVAALFTFISSRNIKTQQTQRTKKVKDVDEILKVVSIVAVIGNGAMLFEALWSILTAQR